MRGALAVVAGVAFALGFAAGRRPVGDAAVTPGPTSREAARAAPERAPAAARDSDERTTEREAATEAVSAAQADWARAEALRAWRDVRTQPMSEEELQHVLESYAQTLRTLPTRQAKYQAEKANKKDADAAVLQSDDALAIMKVDRYDRGLITLMQSSARFASLFTSRIGGATVAGPSHTRDQATADGTTIAFPAGVFALADLGMASRPFPSDVTVRGAGMDRTLLVADTIHPRGNLVRFALEDCTIFAANGITSGGEAGAIALRRVRVVGFDCGGGSSVALYAPDAAALLAQDCRFEGGYGHMPMHSNLLSGGGTMLLARFERCVFDRMSLNWASSASTIFANCAMTDLFGELPNGPTYENCTAQSNEMHRLGQWEQLNEAMRRDLDALFPQWQQQLQQQRR